MSATLYIPSYSLAPAHDIDSTSVTVRHNRIRRRHFDYLTLRGL